MVMPENSPTHQQSGDRSPNGSTGRYSISAPQRTRMAAVQGTRFAVAESRAGVRKHYPISSLGLSQFSIDPSASRWNEFVSAKRLDTFLARSLSLSAALKQNRHVFLYS